MKIDELVCSSVSHTVNIPWTQAEAIDLCQLIEGVCPQAGCHVALTGGLLYRKGPRKDCDLLFYRIRQKSKIDMKRLWKLLFDLGLEQTSGFGWCYKGRYNDRNINMFFPEEQGNEGNPY